MDKKHIPKKLIQDMKRFLGIAPYSNASNHMHRDESFAESLQEKIDKEGLLWDQVEREAWL